MAKTTILCPRCQRRHYTTYASRDYEKGDPPYPALSRLDNATYICSDCGTDEAMRDYAGAAPVPPDEWPVDPVVGRY